MLYTVLQHTLKDTNQLFGKRELDIPALPPNVQEIDKALHIPMAKRADQYFIPSNSHRFWGACNRPVPRLYDIAHKATVRANEDNQIIVEQDVSPVDVY